MITELQDSSEHQILLIFPNIRLTTAIDAKFQK